MKPLNNKVNLTDWRFCMKECRHVIKMGVKIGSKILNNRFLSATYPVVMYISSLLAVCIVPAFCPLYIPEFWNYMFACEPSPPFFPFQVFVRSTMLFVFWESTLMELEIVSNNQYKVKPWKSGFLRLSNVDGLIRKFSVRVKIGEVGDTKVI